MRKEKVKVLIWGFGAMGSGMGRMILNKKGFEIVGVCDANPNYIGKSIHEVLNLELGNNNPIYIESNINTILETKKIDICLLATDSFVEASFPKIKLLVEHKINVISTAEEMADAEANNPELAKEINALAKLNDVTVVGTGINPGMMMDLLVVMMSGVMSDVGDIEVSRVNSLSPFGEAVMVEQGVGLKLEEFLNKQKANKLAGHVGFRESANLIVKGLGLEMTSFTQTMEPIVSNVDRKSKYASVLAGDVAGANMKAFIKTSNNTTITMNHPQQIEPGSEGLSTGDFIKIKGSPEVNLQVVPEIDGGIGTIAICVNMIPHVINSRSGLKTMLDLPVPRAIMGDVREMIEAE